MAKKVFNKKSQIKKKKSVKKVKVVNISNKKFVYFFGNGKADGSTEMKSLLGGKGADLAEMTNLGIPVPPGFTISTEVCALYNPKTGAWPKGLKEEVNKNLDKLEKTIGKKFGDVLNPLLVSVRSGAAFSMPGMMDTVLNLGTNDVTIQGLIKNSCNERFAYDAYRRFIQMFGDVVMGVNKNKFEKKLDESKKAKGVILDTELNAEDLKKVVEEYKQVYKENIGTDFPSDPREQLRLSINAVFRSWNNERAITYRKINKIPDDLGTAVNVQAMVFGNMGNTSGTGVAFTRDPATGEKRFFGEYLFNAQGEDVVAGIRTPQEISTLENSMPKIYKQLVNIYKKLELHYRDMLDLEFTIENSVLFMLQSRIGKRTAGSAVKIAVDMVKEKLIDKKTAVKRIKPEQLDQLLHPMIDPKAKLEVIAKGLPASPGAAVGEVVFNAEEAVKLAEQGNKVILVREETSPEDIGGMHVAQGILTARGGMTSHAAVVARGMGKCCVAGCSDIFVDEDKKEMRVKDIVFKEGDFITINGSTGHVIKGKVDLIQPEFTGDIVTILKWADDIRRLKVRANADIPRDAKVAYEFGAEGIGLCRTEHMFFGEERLPAVQEMILAKDVESRKVALAKLLPMQKSDFIGLFREMNGHPVTIRLLDPPLHEFIPKTEEEIQGLAKKINVDPEVLKEKADKLKEFNPMLGHRGCRLGITYPEISEMQVQAIFEAATELVKEGFKVIPEIMIPIVGDVNELKYLKELLVRVALDVMKKAGVKVKYLFGTMIEIPRAALLANEIATEAEFFSFGTNDLTQMVFGYSRDDSGVFLKDYLDKKILKDDPFEVLDQAGVGQLMKMGVEKGRNTKPDLKIGICGEHGGEPSSVKFCHRIGLNYVSCSPYRVPIARLAAAHGVLEEEK
ncbi:MAG: pyruvate, phosphate dikinase [Candidatus Firestonebacteria bacterium]|nr:pyruvate, phosphate dikinase [Candidatus Firestonebacteria bacterium]